MLFDNIIEHLPDVTSRVCDVGEADCSRAGRLHEPERRYVTAPDRFNVVVCSRRAGKTSAAVLRALRVLLAKPGARVCYVTLIRRNCKKYFFTPLVKLLRSKGVGSNPNASDLMVELDNGSVAQCFGVSDATEVETVLGDQWDLVIIDEAQSYRDPVIEELVERAILPSLLDRRGGLDLMGTPPPGGEVGYFWRVFAAGKFQRHRWTLFDNPWIDPSELDELIAARGLTPEHAIYKREFLGQFVVDPESLVFEYMPGRNDLKDGFRPDPDDEQWRFSMGVDLGFSDRDAISVKGWRLDDPKHHLCQAWAWQKNHLDVDQLAKVFLEAVQKWRPVRIVGDTGGHGATKVIRSLESRMPGTVLIESKPASVPDSIALYNDDMRTGRQLFDPDGIIVADMKLTVWEPGKRGQKVSKSFHSDILDADRYAHSCAYHWATREPEPPLTQDEIDRRGLEAKRQQREATIYG